MLGINPILKRHGLLLKIHLVRRMCKKKDTSEFIINNKTITNPAEVANEFNKYILDKRYLEMFNLTDHMMST